MHTINTHALQRTIPISLLNKIVKLGEKFRHAEELYGCIKYFSIFSS